MWVGMRSGPFNGAWPRRINHEVVKVITMMQHSQSTMIRIAAGRLTALVRLLPIMTVTLFPSRVVISPKGRSPLWSLGAPVEHQVKASARSANQLNTT